MLNLSRKLLELVFSIRAASTEVVAINILFLILNTLYSCFTVIGSVGSRNKINPVSDIHRIIIVILQSLKSKYDVR